jgi:hypothetical protein
VRHLPKIASGIVVTTNYDPVLEMVFEDSSRSFTRVFGGTRITEASSAIQLNERALLKLHGDRNYEYTRVLTLSDYQREYARPASIGRSPPQRTAAIDERAASAVCGVQPDHGPHMMILAEVVRRLGGCASLRAAFEFGRYTGAVGAVEGLGDPAALLSGRRVQEDRRVSGLHHECAGARPARRTAAG